MSLGRWSIMNDFILTEKDIIESCIEDCFEGYKELAGELEDAFGYGGIFVRPNLYNMTTKRYQEKMDLSEFLQWGRRNPSRFIEEVFNVQLMDYQRYLIDNSWNKPFVVWAMSRNGGKSVLAALFIMAKMLLIPGFKAYILAGVGSQSIELFTKMEQFAMKNITSFTNLNDIFQSNVVKSQANSTGWVHNPASYTVRTYGGSQVFTLNGAFDNNRSKRSNLNVYDEAMNAADELFHTSEPFTTQNAEFKMGKDYNADDVLAEPVPFPNQLLYCSSAGRTDQYFFSKYKEFSIRMFAGDKRYFCADISCDVIINATVHNKLWPVPLLTQEKVDQAMRQDKEAALREYKNIFTSEGGDGQIIKRATIIRNSVSRPPKLRNEDGKSKWALFYDPARSADNSVILCAEYYKDPAVGWKMRIQNVVNLLNVMKKKKTPMTTPNQIKELKRLLLEYNGHGAADYENILGLYIDAGSGGAGVNISDFLWEDWEDESGIMHRGLIDKEYSPEEARLYPNAITDKMRLIQPSKHKVEMFRALIEMMDMNLIEWPNEYDNRGRIRIS